MPSPTPRIPLLFAHRGGTDHAHLPNSLAALGDAMANGADPEIDVRLSLDGQPVLVHDRFLVQRGVPILVPALPAALLSRLGIPRLADHYRTWGTDHDLSLDLKVVRAWPATLAVARAAGAVDRLWIVHDSLDVLSAIRAADPDVHLVHEARPKVLGRHGLTVGDQPARLAARGIDAQNTRANAWTAEAVAEAHAHGVLAFGSIVHGERSVRAALALGLDGLYTDHVSELVGLARPAAAADPEAAVGSPPIAAVLFDFGHTLFGHAPGPEVVRTEAAALGVELTEDQAQRLWDRIDAAAMAPEEVALGRDLDAEVWAGRWPVLYALADDEVPGLGAALDRNFHDPRAWVPYADAASTLAALAEAGVRIGVVSNTGWDVRAAFVAWDLDRFVDRYTLSYEAAAAKPDPAIFRAACSALGVPPERTLMVGDDPVADRGAASAGLADVILLPRDAPIGGLIGLDRAVARVRGDGGPTDPPGAQASL